MKTFVLLITLGGAAFLMAADGDLPLRYEARRASPAPVIDGKLDDAAWRRAPWTTDFADIEGSVRPRPRFRTRAKILWDDRFVYFAAELEEPHVWATLRQHDSVIFQDNDFEVFLKPDGPGDRYFEFEMNALNTGWDLFLDKPYKDGGKADNSWEIPGLKTAVKIQGTLNDARDRDTGWTLEIAMPWSAFEQRLGKPAAPKRGEIWRVNFSRVEWQFLLENGEYKKIPGTKEDNWVWSPQGVINMHVPEKWGFVRFVR